LKLSSNTLSQSRKFKVEQEEKEEKLLRGNLRSFSSPAKSTRMIRVSVKGGATTV